MIRKEYEIKVLDKTSTHADIYKDVAGNLIMNILLINGENVETLSTSNTYKGIPELTESEMEELQGLKNG